MRDKPPVRQQFRHSARPGLWLCSGQLTGIERIRQPLIAAEGLDQGKAARDRDSSQFAVALHPRRKAEAAVATIEMLASLGTIWNR